MGCSTTATKSDASTSSSSAPAAAIAPDVPPPLEPKCAAPIPVYDNGVEVRTVCPERLEAEGLTVVDLSDDWTNALFDVRDGSAPPYRQTLVDLANERFGDGPEHDRARADRYLELYGIFPTPSVVARRLLDDVRHACHDAIDDRALEKLDKPLDPWRDLARQRGDRAHARAMTKKLEAVREERGLETIEDLRSDPHLRTTWTHFDRVAVPALAIEAAQAHLRCDGLLGARFEPGVFDYRTVTALKTWQRKHMIVSWRLDDETRKALAEDSRELDFRALLRSLRERVIDATGLIEDGTARGEPGTVMGRVLDAEAFRATSGRGPLEEGAPDLVSAATEAAARALGWTSPEAAKAFFEAQGPDATARLRVAMKLPPPPRYHGPRMDLRVEIDRGDVWYDYPFDKHGRERAMPVSRRPTLTLFAKDGDREVALVRWPTTIGGWKPERLGKKKLAMVYKESPEGPRVWRDLVVAPVWVPPESAPKRDLVRPRPGGGWALATDVFGPGYASAYGLVMLVHHRVARIKGVADPLRDQGIRTHGSVSYDSIHHGTSHGCHRLFNHMALRLGGFLLAHRPHVARGPIPLDYGRTFNWEGKQMRLAFESRGTLFELDPPVAVEVLRGRIMGKELAPITEPRPLPERLAERFTQERFED